jgi:hypothetical protein
MIRLNCAVPSSIVSRRHQNILPKLTKDHRGPKKLGSENVCDTRCRETKIERVLTTLLPNSIKQGRKRANNIATELNQTWPQQGRTEVSKNCDRGSPKKSRWRGVFGGTRADGWC